MITKQRAAELLGKQVWNDSRELADDDWTAPANLSGCAGGSMRISAKAGYTTGGEEEEPSKRRRKLLQ